MGFVSSSQKWQFLKTDFPNLVQSSFNKFHFMMLNNGNNQRSRGFSDQLLIICYQ